MIRTSRSINPIRATAFHVWKTGCGKHQFIHLSDTAATRMAFAVSLLASSLTWGMTALDVPGGVLMGLSSFALHMWFAHAWGRKFGSPMIAGVLSAFCALALVQAAWALAWPALGGDSSGLGGAVTAAVMHLTYGQWLLDRLAHSFGRVPEDMRRDGYRPE